jgi:hypothetical protein
MARNARMGAAMSSSWYADGFSGNDRGYSPCMHRNVVVDTSGGRRFVEGEVTDDIQVRALCLDCGEYLTESKVRGAWRGEYHEIEPILELESDYGYE